MEMIFLVFSYRVSSTPSRYRAFIWRKLKEMGAIYLQQGVALLPHHKDMLDALQRLRKQIIDEMQGASTVGELKFLNDQDEEYIIQEFLNARNEEYHELAEDCERLVAELDRLTQKSDVTQENFERNAETLKRLENSIDKAVQRDFFHAGGIDATAHAFDAAQRRLELFYITIPQFTAQ